MSKVTGREARRMILRAMLLRCPHCGSQGILASWFRLKERCPRCGLHLHREETDFFLGAYTIMLIAIEGLFAVGFVAVLLITWPNPPWDTIEWAGVIVIAAGAVIAYPFAQTLFLAVDLIFRPISSMELGWYPGENTNAENNAEDHRK